MNEVQIAAALRGSFLESVLLEVNERGGAMSMGDLDQFTGGRADTNEAVQEQSLSTEGHKAPALP